MGAVQVGHEVPQDAPQIWSHVVTGYEDTPCTADEGLVSLPPCKILTVDPVVGSKELSLPKAQPVPEVLEAQMPEVHKESEVSQSETQVVQQLNGRRKSDLVGNLEVLRRESLSETSQVFDAKPESLLPDKWILHRTLFFAGFCHHASCALLAKERQSTISVHFCTGLLIGINYFGSASELHGCVDDVHRMLPLVEKWGFSEEGCSKVLPLAEMTRLD